MPSIKILNIKADFPSVDEARALLNNELSRAYENGSRFIKIIHGYGSTGVGGKLKNAIRNSLIRRKKEGFIENIIFGENFSNLNRDTEDILKKFPMLKNDVDYKKRNEGITIVILAKKPSK